MAFFVRSPKNRGRLIFFCLIQYPFPPPVPGYSLSFDQLIWKSDTKYRAKSAYSF